MCFSLLQVILDVKQFRLLVKVSYLYVSYSAGGIAIQVRPGFIKKPRALKVGEAGMDVQKTTTGG
mgnify:CR=1 FL=1